MNIPLPTYAKIKDKYCITYFGNCNEYLVQLRLLRPVMEATFPGIQVYIAHKQSASHIFQNSERTLTREQLENNKHEFAYIRELVCDMEKHPIESFMLESDIPLEPVSPIPTDGQRTFILTRGTLPTKSLTQKQIETVQRLAPGAEINGHIDGAGWVIGVEHEDLFEAAAKGIKTTLIKTGIGENIYKRLFPEGRLLEI